VGGDRVKLQNAAEGRKIWRAWNPWSEAKIWREAKWKVVELCARKWGASGNSLYRVGPWMALRDVVPVVVKRTDSSEGLLWGLSLRRWLDGPVAGPGPLSESAVVTRSERRLSAADRVGI
jgi:hypothetical protein